MLVMLCGNNTEEIEEYIVGYNESEYKTGWGLKKENEPDCKSDEEIKSFIIN